MLTALAAIVPAAPNTEARMGIKILQIIKPVLRFCVSWFSKGVFELKKFEVYIYDASKWWLKTNSDRLRSFRILLLKCLMNWLLAPAIVISRYLPSRRLSRFITR